MNTKTTTNRSYTMNRKIFWVIIEASLESSNDELDLHEKLLLQHLRNFDGVQLKTFQNIAEDLIHNLLFESFFAAAYLLQKSITEDSILAFAGWVISQGEKNYRNVLNNPDSLYDILQFKPRDYTTQMSIDLLTPSINREVFVASPPCDKYNLQKSVEKSGFLAFLGPKNQPELQKWFLKKIPKLTEAYFESE